MRERLPNKSLSNRSLTDQLKQLKDSFDLSVSKPIDNQKRTGAKFLTFNIHNESFAWPVKYLKEVLINQKIILIPERQEKLCGIINYKNQVLAVFNLNSDLGLPLIEIKTKQDREYNTVLIAKGLDEDISIVIDGLGPILFIVADEIKPKPVTIKINIPTLIVGQIYHKEQLITILNPKALKKVKKNDR
jgi:chemotaxis signal transduction protein